MPPDLSGGKLRWDWDTTFLWAGTVAIRKEVIGAMPDGLRINWHVTEGRFVGPRFEGVVLPGGANWLRIRKDGVANSQRHGVSADADWNADRLLV